MMTEPTDHHPHDGSEAEVIELSPEARRSLPAIPSDNAAGMVRFSDEQARLVAEVVAPGLSAAELDVFLATCRRTGLDPFKKHIYGMRLDGRLTTIVSIDGFRSIAERSGKYSGQAAPEWCGRDLVWREVWVPTPDEKYPTAARVAVYRVGAQHPIYGLATWTEYAKDPNSKSGKMWGKMPATMLAKCAEALALRKAFPDDLSGLYGQEEMDQVEAERVDHVSHQSQRAASSGFAHVDAAEVTAAFHSLTDDLRVTVENRWRAMHESAANPPEYLSIDDGALFVMAEAPEVWGGWLEQVAKLIARAVEHQAASAEVVEGEIVENEVPGDEVPDDEVPDDEDDR